MAGNPTSKKTSRNYTSVDNALVMLFSSFNLPKMNAKRVEYVGLLESNGRVLAVDL